MFYELRVNIDSLRPRADVLVLPRLFGSTEYGSTDTGRKKSRAVIRITLSLRTH